MIRKIFEISVSVQQKVIIYNKIVRLNLTNKICNINFQLIVAKWQFGFFAVVNSGELDPPIPGDVDPPQEVLEEQ